MKTFNIKVTYNEKVSQDLHLYILNAKYLSADEPEIDGDDIESVFMDFLKSMIETKLKKLSMLESTIEAKHVNKQHAT